MVALLAVILLLVTAASAMFWPLRSGRRGRGRERIAADHALRIARNAKLGEINELELDFRLGKLSSEDYAAVNATLRAEAVELNRRIESARENEAA